MGCRNLRKTSDMATGQVSFYNPKRRRVVTVNKDRAVVKRINKTKSADINESNIPPTYFNLAGKRALALEEAQRERNRVVMVRRKAREKKERKAAAKLEEERKAALEA